MYLSLSSVDGSARVFVNGTEGTYSPTGWPPNARKRGRPPWLRRDGPGLDGNNTVAVLATRKELNELGLGGLMGPVVIESQSLK